MPDDQEDGDAVKAGEKTSAPADKNSGIKGILIPAAFAFLGTLVGVFGKGCWDMRIEQQKGAEELELEQRKFDFELVKTAIANGNRNDRLEFLRFLVETNLISDKDIRDGVENYVSNAEKNPIKGVPQIPTGNAASTHNLMSSPSLSISDLQQRVRDEESTGMTFVNIFPGIVGGEKQNILKFELGSNVLSQITFEKVDQHTLLDRIQSLITTGQTVIASGQMYESNNLVSFIAYRQAQK